jgi:hypothetical protein
VAGEAAGDLWREVPVPVFTHSQDIAGWLADKPRDVAVVLAARVALRVIPLNARTLLDSQSDRMLGAFRCAQAAWAVAAYPGQAALLRPAAQTASSGVHDPAASSARSATEWASAAAGSATDEDALRFASHAATYAMAAMGGQIRDDILKSCAADAGELDKECSPVTLALFSTLWPRWPNWARDDWAELEAALLGANEDWEVWTDWYKARLWVGEADQVLEVARATIQNRRWEQGPKVANGQIRQMFEERGIWRHATADEPQREPFVDLERRLSDLRPAEMSIIGAREASRAVPLVAWSRPSDLDGETETAVLSMFRILSQAFVDAKNDLRSDYLLELVVPEQERLRTYDINSGTIGYVSAIAVASIGRPEELASAIHSIRDKKFERGIERGSEPFDAALYRDLGELNRATTINAMAELPLWPAVTPPEWVATKWDFLKRALIYVGRGWEVWVQWYEDRLAGRARSQAHELTYVEVPDELWKQGMAGDPAVVNTWIMRQFERLEDQAVGDPPGDTDGKAPPTIPAQQPAAIEPVWSKGRLTLRKTAAKSDLRGRKFAAALKSLREEMRAFANDISGEANIDKRFLSYVSTLAGQVPEKAPRQAELFQLGHAGMVLAGYAKTVNDEWPAILAARFHALTMHFDDTMRQSPLWREFKRNAAQQTLTPQQLGEAASLAQTTADALRGEEAADVIDPAIPQALEKLAEPLHAAGNELDLIEAGCDLLAYDVVESVNNIVKSILHAAIWARLSGTMERASAGFGTEAEKSIVAEAKRLGKKVGPGLTKLTRRLVLGTGGYQFAGKPLVIWLVSKYPEAFHWLKPVAAFLAGH